jgi:branched-chain amino acid aminotransferase
MCGKVFISGGIVEPSEARISIFDRGFLYGDSVFETLRVYGGVPFKLAEHLERFAASGELVGFTLPWSASEIARAARKTLAAARLQDAYMRIIATRGAGVLGLDPALATDPQLIVLVLELPELPAQMYERGRSASLVSVLRGDRRVVDPKAKTGNYLNSVLAMREARSHGADEAIMLAPDGRVAEASAANVFARIDEVWCTPPLDVGILGGITRRTILDLCARERMAAQERVLWPADLQRANEIFLCASVRELVPVVTLDGKAVGDGVVGPTSKRLRALYAAEVRACCAQARGAEP